jgi:hypothetical protein
MNNKWKLVRESDDLTNYSDTVVWLEFNSDGIFKKEHLIIEVGFCLLMSTQIKLALWQTTTVTEIIENTEDYIKFKTTNSIYELFKMK